MGIVGHTRFLGENADALDFNRVYELGAGFSLPLNPVDDRDRSLRLSASLLRGDGVRGWTLGLGLCEW